ncbi:hypothetical protein H2198_004277 [Neophaeococcomyces mojaviensis]|uniref:Uncharacterized protein n=1 Tax=Neophaeococcomyces mojaviensis TaxID=3383035 RepID=A0ACC3A936_9EURO|nr:hypothetical protein H2198_004277 [Knufia sp. JES_112]
MPTTRKRTAAQADANKKQKTQTGAKQTQPEVKVDEGFSEDAKVNVHIDDDGTIWDASLNLSNVSGNNNKFYVLQVLVDDKKKNTYYAHTRWGRVGEDGQVKTTKESSLDAAKKEYEKKFKDKSGLEWSNRTDTPKDKKYTYIEKSYENDDDDDAGDDDKDDKTTTVKSELDLPTQKLMELIFNENHFNAVLEALGYNQDKLPLGKLGKPTLKQGFEQLKELASLVKHPSLAKNKYNKDRKEVIEEWTNKYYSTIPHVFGRNRPPLIDNHDAITREVAMLDTLSDMEVANTIMNATSKSKDGTSVSKLDQHFKDLKLKELTPLDHKSSEYQELQKLLLNTSSDSHGLRYRLQDIFRVERPGEADRFKKSVSKLKDRQTLLLWHGSRTTNYGGILSQGLRIAPPEAPLNGYAFGKGIYLADCSSKSANYCIPSMSGGTGLLLLVEAELSRPLYEIDTGDSNAEEEAKKHNCIATKGVGQEVPLKWKDASCVHDNLKGVKMPDGKLGKDPNHKGGFLQYNEYISYNIEHLKIRYLLKVAM